MLKNYWKQEHTTEGQSEVFTYQTCLGKERGRITRGLHSLTATAYCNNQTKIQSFHLTDANIKTAKKWVSNMVEGYK